MIVHEGRCLLQAGKERCWRCELVAKDSRYGELWKQRKEQEGVYSADAIIDLITDRMCAYQGDQVGQVGGNPLFRCEKFGSCTKGKFDGIRSCRNCDQKKCNILPGDPIQVVATANGIGDHLLCLTCCAGLRKKHPDRPIIFCCKSWCMPWVAMFDGYDHLTSSMIYGVETFYPHDTYDKQNAQRLVVSRVRYYAEACGGVDPVLPTHRSFGAHVTDWAEQFRNHVVLCPWSSTASRNWLSGQWLILERLLGDVGIPTVVIDTDGYHSFGAFSHRRSDVFRHTEINKNPAYVAALMLVASCVVANDSGMAHLAGILQVPTVSLHGPVLGEKIFDVYPAVTTINGPLPCRGCHWHGDQWRPACDTICASLQAIQPEFVFDRVVATIKAIAMKCSATASDRIDVLMRTIKETVTVSGSIAELGVYRGGAALLMSLEDSARTIYLFDTFTGLPTDGDGGSLVRGEFTASLMEVKQRMAGRNAVFCPGLFPESATEAKDAEFSVVHIDGNLYSTTRDGIDFFWPRLQPGGYLVFDDWLQPNTPGVEKAVREKFSMDMVEQTALYQCRVRKPS